MMLKTLVANTFTLIHKAQEGCLDKERVAATHERLLAHLAGVGWGNLSATVNVAVSFEQNGRMKLSHFTEGSILAVEYLLLLTLLILREESLRKCQERGTAEPSDYERYSDALNDLINLSQSVLQDIGGGESGTAVPEVVAIVLADEDKEGGESETKH